MNFLDKLQKVKDHLSDWHKKWGNDFDYLICDFSTENEATGEIINTYITSTEHRDILRYLALRGNIKITDENANTAHITILQKPEPILKLKTLELIARDISDFDSAYYLIKFLKDCGVNDKLIVYPNTKWRMIYAIFEELATSKNPKDHKTLFTIIEEACHPLMHDGNVESANKTTERFNSLLKYDSAQIDTDTGSFIWIIKSDEFGGGYMLMDKNGDEYHENMSPVIAPKEIDKDIITIKLTDGTLSINKYTGLISLNNVEKTLNQSSQEFKTILKLATNKNYQATFGELLGTNASKSGKRNLSFTIRNIKKALGILPRKKSKNKDVIKNIKRIGYKLLP